MYLKKLLQRENIPTIIAAILTLLGAFFVRFYGLGEYYYTSDEAWHLVVASQPSLWELLKYNFHQEVHPPLSYIIWHYMLLVSHNELWMRSASIVSGILLIPSAYVFGRLYIGRAAAYIMAMVMAFGLLPVVESLPVRAYSMMILALTWAGIFLYKYQETKKRKYLFYYLILAFAALGLNHGSAFVIFAFGILLMLSAYKQKSFADLGVIIFSHLILASLTMGYGYALQDYWQGRQLCYFTISFSALENFSINLMNLLLIFWKFTFPSKLLFIPCFLLCLVIPVKLIEQKKWVLLNIAFTPIIALFLADYLRLFPFSSIARNNLFLFLTFLIVIGYFAEIAFALCADAKKYKDVDFKSLLKEKSIGIFQIFYIAIYKSRCNKFLSKNLVIILIPLLLTSYVAAKDFYRNEKDDEVAVTKNHLEKTLFHLDKYNSAGNVFITEQNNIWQFMLIDGDKGKITYLTENLALYQNDKYSFYFSAFPGIFKNTSRYLYDWQLFATDLFKEMKDNGKMPDIKNIVYFSFNDFTGVIDKSAISVFPDQFGKGGPGDSSEYYSRLNDVRSEVVNFSQALHTSGDVTIKMIDSDPRNDRGVVFLGMTPKFIEDNVLNKNFIDIDNIYKRMVFSRKHKG